MPVRLNSLNYRKNMLKIELKFLILFKNHKHKSKLFKSIKYMLKHTLTKKSSSKCSTNIDDYFFV